MPQESPSSEVLLFEEGEEVLDDFHNRTLMPRPPIGLLSDIAIPKDEFQAFDPMGQIASA